VAGLLENADMRVPSNDNPPYQYASPVNFNGNDPVGLFKDGVLIDIIGEEGNSRDHIQNATYRRKKSISVPNTVYNLNEWDVLPVNTFDGIGKHESTLDVPKNAFESFKMYPNPANGNTVYFKVIEEVQINVYKVLGKLVSSNKVTENKNTIDISNLSEGIYVLRITNGDKFVTKKLVKN
jgi:hypothetical protein